MPDVTTIPEVLASRRIASRPGLIQVELGNPRGI